MLSALIASTLMTIQPLFLDDNGPTKTEAHDGWFIGAAQYFPKADEIKKEALIKEMKTYFESSHDKVWDATKSEMKNALIRVIFSDSIVTGEDNYTEDKEHPELADKALDIQNRQFRLDNEMHIQEELAEKIAQNMLEIWDQQKPKGARLDVGIIARITNHEGKLDYVEVKKSQDKANKNKSDKNDQIQLKLDQSKLHLVEIIRTKLSERVAQETIQDLSLNLAYVPKTTGSTNEFSSLMIEKQNGTTPKELLH